MVYMLTLGVYYILMVNVTIYSSTMDPMGTIPNNFVDPCWPRSIPTSRQQSHGDRQQVPGNFKAYQTTWSCHENPKASGNHDHDIECYYCYSLLYDSYMTFNAVIWRRVMSHGMSQETSRWSIAAERTCDLRVVAAWRNSGIGRFASGGLMPLKPFVFFLLPGIMLRCNDVIWCNDVNCELKSVMSSCHPLGLEIRTKCSLKLHNKGYCSQYWDENCTMVMFRNIG